MPSWASILSIVGCLAKGAFSAPTPASSGAAAPASYPWALPSNYPRQNINILSQGTPLPAPTHFALFGYSYDGSIVNQSYYASGQAYNKDVWGFVTEPGAFGNNTFGSWAFGIGPHKYLWAFNDGRIATYNNNYGQNLSTVTFESWKDWWEYKNSGEPEDHIPTCEIIPFYNVLYCTLDNEPFHFAWCNSTVTPGIGYSASTVGWGTVTDPCTEIVFEAVEVPKGYGDQDPAKTCKKFPDLSECQSHATSASTSNSTKV